MHQNKILKKLFSQQVLLILWMHNIAASFQVNALLIDITGTVSQENKTYINQRVSDDIIYMAASVQEHDCQICFAANLP